MQKIIEPSIVSGRVVAPTSKSYAQRALALALLADGESILRHIDLCRDTEAAIDTIRRFGAKVTNVGATYTVTGGFKPIQADIHIGESGLATRLFTPIAALGYTPITISGDGSILSRPVGAMEQPLRDLGASVESRDGLLPITVCGPLEGGEVHVDGSLGSQFISGLLIALSVARCDTVLHVSDLKSKPYVDMTLDAMSVFGVDVRHDDYNTFYIRAPKYFSAVDYNIEGDWSGASCLLVAGAVAGDVTVDNLAENSKQADKAIVAALQAAGARVEFTGVGCRVRGGELRAFEFDATDCPDLFPALVALAASACGVSTIRGTSRLVHKESDRAATLASEFGKLGIDVDITMPDLMRVEGGKIRSATVDSHNDHRIAMATAVAALRADGPVTVCGAEAVEKSYPNFWREMDKLKVRN